MLLTSLILADMIDQQDATNVDEKGMALTIRSVFIIDPAKKIRLIMSYPASTGRNAAEVLRVVDSLQTGDKYKVTTPMCALSTVKLPSFEYDANLSPRNVATGLCVKS